MLWFAHHCGSPHAWTVTADSDDENLSDLSDISVSEFLLSTEESRMKVQPLHSLLPSTVTTPAVHLGSAARVLRPHHGRPPTGDGVDDDEPGLPGQPGHQAGAAGRCRPGAWPVPITSHLIRQRATQYPGTDHCCNIRPKGCGPHVCHNSSLV